MAATSYITFRAISHRERVCSLYKKAVRLEEMYMVDRRESRYKAVLMRQRFEENRGILDMRKALQLVKDGEEELFQNQHPIPFKFPHSPGGSAYGRYALLPDWLSDMWHPLEKAQYPHYFARREKRKDEWIAYWEKTYNRGKKYDPLEGEWHGGYDEKTPHELPAVLKRRATPENQGHH